MEEILKQLDSQKIYNSKKSSRYKKLYYGFEITVIFMTCFTTFLLTIKDIPVFLPGLASFTAVLLKGISSFVGFQKHWLTCRIIAENLKSEKRKYISSTFGYRNIDQDSKDILLATNLEMIIQNGNDMWLSLLSKSENEGEK